MVKLNCYLNFLFGFRLSTWNHIVVKLTTLILGYLVQIKFHHIKQHTCICCKLYKDYDTSKRHLLYLLLQNIIYYLPMFCNALAKTNSLETLIYNKVQNMDHKTNVFQVQSGIDHLLRPSNDKLILKYPNWKGHMKQCYNYFDFIHLYVLLTSFY